jgi:hypothetical protein
MPGFLVHLGATVICAHGGQAQPTAPNPRVLLGGQPAVTVAAPYAVAGCPFVPPGGNGPCVTAQWLMGAVRVFAAGAPVVLQGSPSVAVPTGAPITAVVTQVRVRGT